jgi:glycosyltransferase involved in cell wall biosynthesis
VRVLYVIDSVVRPGGAEQALAAMAGPLVDRGVDLEVAYLLDRVGFQQELEAVGVTLHQVFKDSRRERYTALRSLLRSRRPNLVHTTLFEADIAARPAAASVRVPVVSSLVNASYGPEHKASPGVPTSRLLAAQGVDLASAQLVRRFHAISEYVADVMSRRLLVPRRRIDVIPRGRDPRRLGERTVIRRVDVRKELGIDLDAPLIVAAARHEHQKGLDVLVNAMGAVVPRRPDAVLLVAGREGNATAAITDAAEAHGLDKSVRLLGPREDVADLMAAADVFVAPSRWEGLGSAVVEAMGVGVPLVVTDVPALHEAVGSAECGSIVPVADPGRLGDAVLDVLNDPGTAQRRATAARARFDQLYRLDRVVDQIMAFYKRALGESRS